MRFVLSAVGVVLDTFRYHYADFQGRTGRREYWTFFVVQSVVVYGVGMVDGFPGTRFMKATFSPLSFVAAGWLELLIGGVVFLPSLAIAVRRLHDVGKSGWYLLVLFVPFVGLVYYLYLMLSESQPDANQYGPHPGRRVDDTDASNETGNVRSSSLQLHVERL